jgi:TonB family protein
MPLRPFAQSAGAHVLALGLVLGASQLNWKTHEIAPHEDADSRVVYVPPAYLPPVDTRVAPAPKQAAPDPAYSPQPIISLPREADNRSQTVVTPAQVKLARPQALPNVLNWPTKTRLPVEPAPVLAAEIERLDRSAPQIQNSVVAPPPDVARSESRRLQTPQQSVIAPPTTLDSTTRHFGDINIAHTAVIAPAPQLAVAERRSYSAGATGKTSAVVGPPPSVSGGRRPGSLVALSLQPAVGAPPVPAGNRRGTFAATPEGRPGGAGTPVGSSGGTGTGGNKTAQNSGLPAGIYVGKPPVAAAAGITAAKASLPHPAAATNVSATHANLSGAERQLFGDRRVYSLTLNMPNLNSAGGSWIVRFAELDAERSQHPATASGSAPEASLAAPLAARKVDPAYPIELMRQNVAGTVVLSAIIHADGSVTHVQVLESADERLDLYASQALARWEFRPATKNGTAVDVEAVFRIPFRPAKHTGF